MHFDLYNTSTSDLAGPRTGPATSQPIAYLRRDEPLLLSWMCLNFLMTPTGDLFGFCGEPRVAGEAFMLTLFDSETLEKLDESKIARVGYIKLARGDLPMNLGYFVMDARGRVIVVNGEGGIKFLRKGRGREIVNDLEIEWPRSVSPGLDFDQSRDHIAQVVPAYDEGYWFMALGEGYAYSIDEGPWFATPSVEREALIGWLSESGEVADVHRFEGAIIENGIAVDESGAYVVTDREILKLRSDRGRISVVWQHGYAREWEIPAAAKPGTLSVYGSGSTPTLSATDLVSFTDNAPRCPRDVFEYGESSGLAPSSGFDFSRCEGRINLVVRRRNDGRLVCRVPLFKPGRSANENTLVAHGDSLIAQNWYGAPPYKDHMWGMEPGLTRVDVRRDRSGCDVVWQNETFASSATVRLSTPTGLLYAPVHTDDETYAMSFIDFETGLPVQQVHIGGGPDKKIHMAPPSILPDGRIVQPVKHGVVVIENAD